jgi:hypothetical protein
MSSKQTAAKYLKRAAGAMRITDVIILSSIEAFDLRGYLPAAFF